MFDTCRYLEDARFGPGEYAEFFPALSNRGSWCVMVQVFLPGDRNWRRQMEWALANTEEEAKQKCAMLSEISRLENSQDFHWRDGLFFRRGKDGLVVIYRRLTSEYIPELIAEIPSHEWASIVCSVSAGRENLHRWDLAQDFHGRSR